MKIHIPVEKQGYVALILEITKMNPYIEIFGLNLSSYGLLMLIAVLTVFFFAWKRAKKLGILTEDVIIIMATSLGFILFFGYVVYILVTYPIELILKFLSEGNYRFLENGGLVFYGGVGGAVIGALLGMRITQITFYELCYVFIPFVPLGHAIGRVGCFMAGCCNGIEYDGVFAVYYKNSIFGLSPGQGYFPVQLFEAFFNVIICRILVIMSEKTKRKPDILFAYFVMYAIIRFGLEWFRGDSVRGFVWLLSTSQWISILLIGISMIYFFVARKKV